MKTTVDQQQALTVMKIGEHILTQKAVSVDDPSDPSLRDLIHKMFNTMNIEKGCGLAAPQVNVLLRVVTIELDHKKYAMINPEITHASEEMVLFTEGCLSVPGTDLQIIRHRDVVVTYHDEYNKSRTLKARGVLAIACQHEIDHLDGILITDRFAHQKALREHFNITL